jgi:hypothetical protein
MGWDRRGTPHGTARHGTARHGTAWHGTAWHGTTWHGMARRKDLHTQAWMVFDRRVSHLERLSNS